MTNQTQQNFVFGKHRMTIEDVINIAFDKQSSYLNNSPKFKAKIKNGTDFLDKLLKEDGVIYGVTTGYGDSCTRSVPLDLINTLPIHLSRFHGCGLGEYFSPNQARAVLAARLCSLSQGVSGVSYNLMEHITTLLNKNIMPVIPQEGSVGASGDLTPLSYLAAVLIGERQVYYQGNILDTKAVYELLGIKPITLRPKEGLAIMNGTAVMTGLACEAYHRTQYLCKLASRITAMASIALKGNAFHFDEKLFSVKPHQGQAQIAKWISSDLEHSEMPRNSDRLQDRYSIRCAPHVIGVIQDSLGWFRTMIENELNSANDNPIIDGENQHVLHGGHFYGGHIATVMDTMKTQVANLADLLDRQMALLMDTKFNNGLPPNLSFSNKETASINHGFKAVQIGTSAWTAEALKLTMPASVFSRSTECHNQDKVSMGTIAARDCLRVLELTEQVFAAQLLASTQAIIIRIKNQQLEKKNLSNALASMIIEILNSFELVSEDRPLENDLRKFVALIQQQNWSLYDEKN
ncbi:aromatic amino acid ammonia-lyase [Francisellaceae bacterium]|nr:aromatic amino acid ammonia-lyase [Francisellaceae bacterium]